MLSGCQLVLWDSGDFEDLPLCKPISPEILEQIAFLRDALHLQNPALVLNS